MPPLTVQARLVMPRPLILRNYVVRRIITNQTENPNSCGLKVSRLKTRLPTLADGKVWGFAVRAREPIAQRKSSTNSGLGHEMVLRAVLRSAIFGFNPVHKADTNKRLVASHDHFGSVAELGDWNNSLTPKSTHQSQRQSALWPGVS